MDTIYASGQMRRLISGAWNHGEDGYWDRVSALRAYILALGGVGKPGETPVVVAERRRKIELNMISWARQDPNDYAAYAFTDSSSGLPIEQERMHFEIQRALSEYDNVSVCAYRGSGKTTQIAEIRALWELGNNPDLQFKLVSEGGDTAVQRVRNNRNHVDRNSRNKMVFPGMTPGQGMPWNDEAFTLTRKVIARDPSFFGAGYNSSVVGGRCSHLIGDDIVPPGAMTSAPIRSEVKSKWQNVWCKMLFSQTGRIWYPHTPWHELDLSAEINKSNAFHHLRFAVGGPDGCAACPDHGYKRCGIPYHNPWAPRHDPSDRLKLIHDRDGSLSYSRSHLLIPITSETSLYPESLFATGVKRPDLVLGRPWRWWASYGIRRVFGVDLALGAGTGHDYTVIYVLGFDEQGTRYTIDIIRRQTDDYRVQLQLVIDAYAKYMPDLIYIEGTQYQRVFSNILTNTTALPIRPFYPLGVGTARKVEGAAKRDLKFGVPGMRIYFENKRWFFPYGDDHSREEIDIHINELQHFAISESGSVEGVGAHDDTVMAAWIATTAALRLGADLGDASADGLGEGLEGIEDLPAALALRTPGSGPGALKGLGEFVPIAPGSATSIQIPATCGPRPDPKIYDAIYGALVALKLGAQLDALARYLDALGEPPSASQLLQSGFAPRCSGSVSSLCGQHGSQAIEFVCRDLYREHQRGQLTGDRFALARMGDEDAEELFGAEDVSHGARLPEGAVGTENLF